MEKQKAVSLTPTEMEQLAHDMEAFAKMTANQAASAEKMALPEEVLEMDSAKAEMPAPPFETVGPLFGAVNSIAELRAKLDEMIPDKMAFKIGEVSEITKIKPYVLRYWETEFETLNPQKSAFNQRMYTRKDVENVLLIKKLLYEDKFSIAGAKKKLKELKRELKSERHWDEVTNKHDKAMDRLRDMIVDLARLKTLFQ